MFLQPERYMTFTSITQMFPVEFRKFDRFHEPATLSEHAISDFDKTLSFVVFVKTKFLKNLQVIELLG
jgi:hypothetical protein